MVRDRTAFAMRIEGFLVGTNGARYARDRADEEAVFAADVEKVSRIAEPKTGVVI